MSITRGRITDSDLRTLVMKVDICQGAEEQWELHARYCIPLAEQLAPLKAALNAEVLQ